ncbi:MAG: ATP-binding protein [Solirubrobacterales bacterium]
MRRLWDRLGLRGRLALSIGTIVVLAYGVVFIAVRAQMAHESNVIEHEETGESNGGANPSGGDGEEGSPISDAQSDVEKSFFLLGGVSLLAALAAGYLVAARTASPLRRFAATAAEVDAGAMGPRLDPGAGAPAELVTLAEAFNHMLDRLDRAFEQQRRFVSDASHELRSPLTAIRGQIEVLARSEEPSGEEVRRVERLTLAEMGRVERMVDDLLALARLDEGAEPAPRPLAAAELLRDLAAAAPTELGELAEGTLRADPDLLARVVRNLLDNAHRHAERVVISSRAVPDPAGGAARLLVAVDDDGPGIPPAERERVFDRFHRTQAGRDRASGGSGLGLGIVRAIVAAHGGRVWVEDSPLGGARVAFELPGFTPA